MRFIFHPEASKRIGEQAQDILRGVQGLGSVNQMAAGTSQIVDLHPMSTIGPEDITSASKFVYSYDAAGDPSGVFWVSGGMRVGL